MLRELQTSNLWETVKLGIRNQFNLLGLDDRKAAASLFCSDVSGEKRPLHRATNWDPTTMLHGRYAARTTWMLLTDVIFKSMACFGVEAGEELSYF